MSAFEHRGVSVWEEPDGLHVSAGVDTASWQRMDRAGWPVHLLDGWKRQSDGEIAEALRAYRGR